ncbi:DUF4192 domain-containing protein [Microbacteriaceae bacterium VKM Ac-2855]|nr:DUF4192 domain-containing protein [Microbacteriaceae bacterium VKM Ac-2855]
MQTTSTHAPTLIHRASTPADFLSTVPHLIGFLPERSVVLVPFVGKRSCGALRFDLPTGDSSVLVPYVVAMLCRYEIAESVRVVVYSADDIAEAWPLPEEEFVEDLLSALRGVGFRRTEAWLVAADGWTCYTDDEFGRRSSTELAAAASALTPDAPPLRSVAERATPPAVDPVEMASVRVEVAALLERCPDHTLPESERMRALAAIRRVAKGGPRPSSSVSALILVLVQRQDRRRDVLLEGLWLGDHRARSRAIRPPLERVERVIELAGYLAACAAEPESSAAFAFLAIAHWACGQNSVAGAVTDRALDLDPGNPDLHALSEMFSAGAVAPWIRFQSQDGIR